MDKIEIRKEMLAKRKNLDKEFITRASSRIVDKIRNNEVFIKAKVVALYSPINGEADIRDLLFENKIFCFPKVVGNDLFFYRIRSLDELRAGYYNIAEPDGNDLVKKEDIDLVLVPLVAFDEVKNRIGYGKGFYDRFLSGYTKKAFGVAYGFQKIPQIDISCLDIPLDDIITEVE